jgi:hypothetical protein
MDLLPFYDDNPEFHCLTFERKKKNLKLADCAIL